ncbi:MAG: hypothetical protein ACK44A_04005 [Roseateles sp.]
MSAGRLFITLGLALLPLGSALAAPHIVDLQWDASGRFAHQADVPAGKFVEVCGALKPGQQVAWRFSGGAPMDFNIHYHLGKETVYPVQLTAVRQAEQTLQVRSAQVHCWMWTNKGHEAATLSVTLSL